MLGIHRNTYEMENKPLVEPFKLGHFVVLQGLEFNWTICTWIMNTTLNFPEQSRCVLNCYDEERGY